MTDSRGSSRQMDVIRLGLSRYGEAHAEQQKLVERRLAGEIPDTLVLTEHEPVLTVGRGASRDGLEDVGLPVVEVERGGEVTFHGPGQLVVYPIFELPPGRRDLHRYLRDLEEVVVRCLDEVDVRGVRRPGLTGVWIGERKVASVGVAVRHWVTWHGFALNVHTDLSAFERFRPCGLDPGTMTRVADHAEIPPTTMLFQVLAIKHACEVFDLELPPLPPPSPPPAGASILPLFPGP